MTVYIDDMYLSPMGRYGRMKMSHMIADTHDELMKMATHIGLAHKWLQKKGAADEHFDVSMEYRERAIKAGAVPVTMKELVGIIRKRLRDGTPRITETPAQGDGGSTD